MDALLTSLNLAVQHGIDPDPDNAVAVATFAYQDAAGHPQQVWSLKALLHPKHLSSKLQDFPDPANVRGTCLQKVKLG